MGKILFSTILSILFLVQIACGQTQPSNSELKAPIKTEGSKPDYPNLKTQAEEVNKATVSGDFTRVIHFTHSKVVEMSGDKDKMISFMKAEFDQMKAEGFEIEKITTGEIRQIEKIGNELFGVVSINMTIKTPNGKAAGEGTLVGISMDNGVNWKFIGAIDQKRFQTLFPKAAEKIQIPDQKPPVLIETE